MIESGTISIRATLIDSTIEAELTIGRVTTSRVSGCGAHARYKMVVCSRVVWHPVSGNAKRFRETSFRKGHGMVVKGDTTKLKSALADEELTLLLLSGNEASVAGKIHDFLDGISLEDWRKYFLITDLGALDQQQRDTWFGGANTDRYAVLGGDIPKQVACTGAATDLLRADGKPSIIKIRSVYSQGDQL